MKIKLRLSTLCLSFISIPFFMTAPSSYAQDSTYSHYSHADAYDDGYDDGYDDAMDDCPCPPWRYLLSGFYAGISGGYEGYQIVRHPMLFDDQIGSFNTHANGWNGRLFGGYNAPIYRNFHLGGEIFVGTTNASGTDSINTIGTQFNSKFSAGTSFGASLLPGFQFGNNGPLTYVRLGYIQTELKVSDWSNSIGSTMSHWTSGFNTGLGVEVPLYKNFSGRLEYDYINYSSFTHNGNVGSTNSPSDNRASLDFLYHFNF